VAAALVQHLQQLEGLGAWGCAHVQDLGGGLVGCGVIWLGLIWFGLVLLVGWLLSLAQSSLAIKRRGKLAHNHVHSPS